MRLQSIQALSPAPGAHPLNFSGKPTQKKAVRQIGLEDVVIRPSREIAEALSDDILKDLKKPSPGTFQTLYGLSPQLKHALPKDMFHPDRFAEHLFSKTLETLKKQGFRAGKDGLFFVYVLKPQKTDDHKDSKLYTSSPHKVRKHEFLSHWPELDRQIAQLRQDGTLPAYVVGVRKAEAPSRGASLPRSIGRLLAGLTRGPSANGA